MDFMSNLKEGLINGLIGSIPVVFFIGVTTIAVRCSKADASPEGTVTIVDSEVDIIDANIVKE
jgi:hypothetical protein